MMIAFSLLASVAVASMTAASLDADWASHEMVLIAHAQGAQIYQCKAGEDGRLRWLAREPIATLIVDGRTVGRHYAGPRWALDDGSVVAGKVIASAPGPSLGDIPLLKLAVSDHLGAGALSPATLVFRVHTHGGVLTGGCPGAGMLQAVPYSADYVFVK